MSQILDWIAQSYLSNSAPLNASRAVNMFAELEVQDAKSKAPVAVWGCPGTSPFADTGNTPVLALKVMNNVLYAVSGSGLYQISPDGTATFLGTTLVQPTFVSIDTNGIQLVWVDGQVGWVYQPGGLYQPTTADASAGATVLAVMVTGTITFGDTLTMTLDNGYVFTTTAASTSGPGPAFLTLAAPLPYDATAPMQIVDAAVTIGKITDPNFYPADTVVFFDGYFCFNRSGTKQFFLSPINAVTPFDALLVASKEATADLLLALANAHEQLYLFGRDRTEVWFDAGNAPPTFPFQRSDGAIIQRGLGAVGSIVLEDNTVFFLGDDGMFYRLDGFKPERLSNHGVETQWSKYATLSDCQASVYTLFGHKMVTLTFPTAAKTWVVDLSTRRWHERESWLGANADTSIGRWRVSTVVTCYNRILLGDSQSGQIAQLNQDVFTEFGATIRGMVVGPPIHNDRRRVSMRRFELDVESGVGLQAGASTSSQQFCSVPVAALAPVSLDTAGALLSTPATFSTALFSGWVKLPDDSTPHGLWFSNQPDDDAPGNGGLQIGIFNDQSSSAGQQVVVRAYDAVDTVIVEATYAFTAWANWVWLGISMDTVTQRIQVYVNDGTGGGETVLSPSALVWSSVNPISNKTGQPWHIRPAST